MIAALLELRELEKRFGSVLALDRVSMQVREGEIFGLLGPNGAGKTTLISIAAALLAPTAGEVTLLGRPVRGGDRDQKRAIGLVPQEIAIYPELSARENLAFFGKLYGLSGSLLAQRVEEVLRAVGLIERADDRAGTFSGGMKRRLNLGAGLVHEPRLLFLDEPTIGVDPQSRNHIFDEVRRLNAAGVTILYTSHYMEEVQALCSRIAILDRGKLIACDTLAGLLRLLTGVIRFRVPEVTPALRARLQQVPDAQLVERNSSPLELQCRDVKPTLLRLVNTLNELDIPLTGLEIEEPNLERVFLHLTGRALRD
jgi:ABC-2 type transport system ATP-binding protein